MELGFKIIPSGETSQNMQYFIACININIFIKLLFSR